MSNAARGRRATLRGYLGFYFELLHHPSLTELPSVCPRRFSFLHRKHSGCSRHSQPTDCSPSMVLKSRLLSPTPTPSLSSDANRQLPASAPCSPSVSRCLYPSLPEICNPSPQKSSNCTIISLTRPAPSSVFPTSLDGTLSTIPPLLLLLLLLLSRFSRVRLCATQ